MASPTSRPNFLDAPKPLADDITNTSKTIHTRINKLITARLPLALPPQATDAGQYISGLLHFMPVYLTFESLWQAILDSPPTEDDTSTPYSLISPLHAGHLPPVDKGDEASGQRFDVPARIYTVLKEIYLPELSRSESLRSDILALTGWPEDVLNDQLKIISSTGRLGEFISHIEIAVHKKPHVLIAYSYVLFMALFAGGRFIRASFESAGDEFWRKTPSPIEPTLQACSPDTVSRQWHESTGGLNQEEASQAPQNSEHCNTLPLRFWHFSTAQDGEDLKRDYKAKLLHWENKLTAQERHDIIQESICIFESIGLIVVQLDEVWKDHGKRSHTATAYRSSLTEFFKNSLGGRHRDSVAVTKERSTKTRPRRALSGNTLEKGLPDHSVDGDAGEKGSPAVAQGPGRHRSRSIRFAQPLPVPQRDHNYAPKEGIYGSRLPKESQRFLGISIAEMALLGGFCLLVLWATFFTDGERTGGPVTGLRG